ncbi:hypothetical protein [Pseudomonas sp. 24 E 13]|jgi:hypothetical protein|nr:putative hydrolase [Pseudomonas poae RE*1-1-14]CRM31447.1 hypothetical protein [Pseudomonas sp. 44 R 15]CRM80594.1 hypothetical protein [Pseudomonas sp. 24 E 13]CRM99000.1 hypothetical protein [Pseudomonas sp. 34 E 7]
MHSASSFFTTRAGLNLHVLRSDFLPAATLQAMRDCNAQVRTAEVADASHYVHDDQGAGLNRLVIEFLHRLAISGR